MASQNTLWTVHSTYGYGKADKYDGLYWALKEANQEAKFVLFSHDPRNRDITEVICDQPDKPYSATNTELGGGSVHVTVVQVSPAMVSRFRVGEISAALKAKGLRGTGSKAVVAASLEQYLQKLKPATAQPSAAMQQNFNLPKPSAYEEAMMREMAQEAERRKRKASMEQDSRELWVVLAIYNGGRGKEKWEGVSWVLEEANETARQMLESLPNKDETEIDDEIGEPYAGFTCFGYGSGSLSVSVEEVTPDLVDRLKFTDVKKALKAKGLPDKGSKTEVVDMLKNHLASLAPAPEPAMSNNEKEDYAQQDAKRFKPTDQAPISPPN